MGIIEIDKLDTLLARHAELKVAVDAFGQTLNEVQRYANETNIVVKDIYNGTNAIDWISDLKTAGKSSVTYGNKERMEFLLTYSDAVNNTEINQYIFDYGIENNLNIGLFYQVLLGNEPGVTWESLTTFDAVCKNELAFKKVCDKTPAITLAKNNKTSFHTMAINYNYTESIITSSTVALGVLSKETKTVKHPQGYTGIELNEIAWVDKINVPAYGSFDARWTWKYKTIDDSTHTGECISAGYKSTYGSHKDLEIRRFVKLLEIQKLEVNDKFSYDKEADADIYGANIK